VINSGQVCNCAERIYVQRSVADEFIATFVAKMQAARYGNPNIDETEFGLTSSIFSKDLNEAMYVVDALKFGETYVNREHFEAMQGYHAGWRKSGIGGADGKHGLMEFTQTHIVYLQRT
jgi:lactaldehyde dehydrogenase/glycolaldehyde dehydrogenase